MSITISRQKKTQTNIHNNKKCFQTDPSITTIAKQRPSSSFNFQKTNEVMKIISQLNTTKTCQNADTPTKIIKLNKDIFARFISRTSTTVLMKVIFDM